jgi:hypothetical protein
MRIAGESLRQSPPARDETNRDGDGYGKRDSYICWATPSFVSPPNQAHHCVCLLILSHIDRYAVQGRAP